MTDNKELRPEAKYNMESFYQPLFNLMNEEYGLLLLNEEMREIIDVVNKMQGYVPPQN